MSGMVLATASGDQELRGANPYLEWGTTAPPPPGSVGGGVAGVGMSTEGAVQIAAVYGAVGLLADSVASLPLRALDRPPTQVATAKELKTPQLLAEPCADMELTDWLVQFVWALALRGNFYGRIVERDKDLYARQILPIPPDAADVRRLPKGEIEYRFFGQKVPIDDVFHVKYQSMPGMLKGLNPIECMRYPLGIARALDRMAESYFRNSANPSVVIEVPGDLNKEAVEQLVRRWLAHHQGVQNGNLPAVVTGGGKVTPLTITPEDSQFLESRKFSKEDISGLIFRVPPFMLGMVEKSTSFGRGIEQQERTFVANTLQGYLTRGERALSRVMRPGEYANFDLSQRLRGDTEQRAKSGALLMAAGAFVGDDVRAWFDKPPLPDGLGQQVFTPANSGLLLEAIKAMEEPAPEGDGFDEDEPPGSGGMQ